MVSQAVLYNARERRRESENFGRFAALIASPEDLGSASAGVALETTLTLPGAGWIGVGTSAGIEAGDITVETATGRTIQTLALEEDGFYRIGYFEKGTVLTFTVDVADDLTVYVYDTFGKPIEIATGIIT